MNQEHVPLKEMTTDRLQVELWRVVHGSRWGDPDGERMAEVPAKHLEALLQYVAALEHRVISGGEDLPKLPGT